MSERKPGWYWVHVYGNWEPAYTDDGDVFDHIDSRVDKVGPRIPTPDEPWQCVPIVPTREMMESTGDTSAEAYSGMLGAWMMMLSSAPKPEDS